MDSKQFPFNPESNESGTSTNDNHVDVRQWTEEEVAALREDLLEHVKELKLPSNSGQTNDYAENQQLTKDAIRASHSHQRKELIEHEKEVFGRRWPKLLRKFANGIDVIPGRIKPKLMPVNSSDWTGYLFRFAALLWSVPVSKGFGRRMRYLVFDESNDKLIGILALGDPVFNLSARDEWIGWNVDDRRARLVNVLDAYVLGAVPPYSKLLGGKLIASLIASREISTDFNTRYGNSTGIISEEQKSARLVLVTVTSALGRSSLYNRLRLQPPDSFEDDKNPFVELNHIGATRGYGHFHLSNSIFHRIRSLLSSEGHEYADGHQYGDGPNWRIRVIRVGLRRLGLDQDLLRHGIQREVYAMPLASDFREYLCGEIEAPSLDRPLLSTITEAALERWVIPRAARFPEYREFNRGDVLEMIKV